jgi:hypothetical protein
MEKRRRRGPKEIERLKLVDGKPLCWCSVHKDYLPCEEFTPSITYYHGYNFRCRSCDLEIRSEKKRQKILERGPVYTEREILNNFYREIGYDPESPIPIHEQFLIRHDL